MDDRRLFVRVNVKFPLKFLVGEGKTVGEAETVDISASGIGFVTNEKLPEKVPLEIWLQIPDNHQALNVKGKVIWSDRLEDSGKQRVGLLIDKANFMGLARVFRV